METDEDPTSEKRILHNEVIRNPQTLTTASRIRMGGYFPGKTEFHDKYRMKFAWSSFVVYNITKKNISQKQKAKRQKEVFFFFGFE